MKKNVALWSDRTLFEVPVSWSIATTPEIFNSALAEIYAPEPAPVIPPQKHDFAGATMHQFVPPSGIDCCLVYMPFVEDRSSIQQVALIVHEAMHVWRVVRESLGEDEPSSEFEAYSMQSITQDLLLEYKRQVFGE